MSHVGFTEFRQKLAAHFDAIAKSRAPLVVTRQKGPSMVVLSEEEYEAMQETLHLLQTSANAARIMASIAELDAGAGVEREISGDKAAE